MNNSSIMTDVNTLKELLSKDYKNIEDYDRYFAEIAKELMCNYVIQKGKEEYDIIEIEFYLFTPNHPDVVTYPRDTDAGLWFFHPSGVDITFNSLNVEFADNTKRDVIKKGTDVNTVFGGILIRGIRRSDGKYTFGPNKCVDELWNELDAFSSNDYPALVYKENDFIPDNLWRGKRWIKIKESDRQKHVQEWYDRAGLSNFANVENYIHDILNSQVTHKEKANYLYRFVYLSEEEIKKIKSSDYAARPQIKAKDSEEYAFAEMSKV